MKGVSTNPKVLLCTYYRRFPRDYATFLGTSLRGEGPSAACKISPGLRFIKQNIPEVEILEYPLWQEYVDKLKEGWDVVGFSFYHIQTEQIERMVEEARRQEIREIWAGNYGALTSDIPGIVDKVIVGPGEDSVAQCFGYRVSNEGIEHPPILVSLSFASSIRFMTFGVLHTTRGCPFRCSFCQGPVFEKKHFHINFESIERVLAYYHKQGIKDIAITDETFGTFPDYTDKLTRLLARYKFRWMAQSRTSLFLRNLDMWYERGLRMAAIGVESMNQSSLDWLNKTQKPEDVLEFARQSSTKPGLYRVAFYMIGYENMSTEDIIRDAIRLKQAGFDSYQVSILTPRTGTLLWAEINNKYGIFDTSPQKYGAEHLVWNHPIIPRIKMQYLRQFLRRLLNPPIDIYRYGLRRLIWEELKEKGGAFLWETLLQRPFNSLYIDDRKQVFFPKVNPSKTGGSI